MSFAWETSVPIPLGAISLHELSLLVAERMQLEALGAPRVSPLEVAPPATPRRCRPHTWARRRNAGAGRRSAGLGADYHSGERA